MILSTNVDRSTKTKQKYGGMGGWGGHYRPYTTIYPNKIDFLRCKPPYNTFIWWIWIGNFSCISLSEPVWVLKSEWVDACVNIFQSFQLES